jgi:hypothetical protein
LPEDVFRLRAVGKHDGSRGFERRGYLEDEDRRGIAARV